MGEAHEIFMRPLDLIDLDDGSAFSGYLIEKNLLVEAESIS
jgi:hypothetical protein